MPRHIPERERELAELAAAAADAVTGAGSVVLVSGEAGIGKSSLVEAAHGCRPSKGGCSSGTATTSPPAGRSARSGTVSVRTVDNHVAVVLAKLGARSWREAAARGDLGLM